MILLFVYLFLGITIRSLLGGKPTDVLVDGYISFFDDSTLNTILDALLNPANDFVDYSFQAYILKSIFPVPMPLVLITLNSLWVFWGLFVSCKFLQIPFRLSTRPYRLYTLVPISVFGIIPFSFRDSYVLGLILVFLCYASSLLNNRTTFSNLFISILSLFLISRARLELVPLLIAAIFVSLLLKKVNFVFFAVNFASAVRNNIILLFSQYKVKLYSCFRVKSRFLKVYLLSGLLIVIFVPFAFNLLIGRIYKGFANNQFEALSAYQETRINRGKNFGSGTDVINEDQFANMSLGLRYALQLANNIVTPIRIFPVSATKLMALSDSIIYLCIWSYCLNKIFRLRSSILSSITPRSVTNLYYSWSIISLLLFSLIISNGGNAFRYKSLWAVPLTLSLMSEICTLERLYSRDKTLSNYTKLS